MRGAIAQATLANINRLDRQMRRHREVAEQALAFLDLRMLRGNDIAKAPDRDIAKAVGSRKQLPVFHGIAEHGVSDVVGGEGEAIDFHQEAIVRQRLARCQRSFRQ
jgi:hypothetical protein